MIDFCGATFLKPLHITSEPYNCPLRVRPAMRKRFVGNNMIVILFLLLAFVSAGYISNMLSKFACLKFTALSVIWESLGEPGFCLDKDLCDEELPDVLD